MPVKFSFAEDLTPRDIDAANQAMTKMQKSGRYADILGDPDVIVKFTRDVEQGAGGTYNPRTNELKVAPQRARGNIDELISTVRHEVQHAMQNQSPGYGTVGEYSRRRISKELQDAATREDLNYGSNELEAFVAANMRPGIPSTDPRIDRIKKELPGQLEDLYSRTAQPMRNPVNHTKHEAEWTTTEKVLNTLFGFKPPVTK
jgi:hypothetical protein